jgi:predicted SAM-dependent methyltransferase
LRQLGPVAGEEERMAKIRFPAERNLETAFSPPIRLELGCGRYKKEGFIGIDLVETPVVDVLCDLNEGIPFGENTVDEVLASHFLQHLNTDYVYEFINHEVFRVCKRGALVEFWLPYGVSQLAQHPGHKTFFTEEFFQEEVPRDKYDLVRVHFEYCDFVHDEQNPFHALIKEHPEFARLHLNNIVRQFAAVLRVKK